MKFKYKRFRILPTKAFPERKYLLRPIIPILLNWQDKKIGYEVLIEKIIYPRLSRLRNNFLNGVSKGDSPLVSPGV